MILITGANGFIGRNLKEYFKGTNILAPTSKELNLLDSNKTKKYIKENKIETIIHCASRGLKSNYGNFRDIVSDNLQMFTNLIKASNDNTFIINMGSGAEYDKSRPLIQIKESNFGDMIPKDPYGYSKFLISKEIEKYSNVINLRLFGVYGPYENHSRFPSYAIIQNINNRPIAIKNNSLFSYLFVDDLSKIVEQFMYKKPSERFFNITPNENVDMLKISKIINELSDKKTEIILDSNVQGLQYSGDNSLLLSVLNNFKFSSIYEGLKKLFDYYKNNSEGNTLL